LLARQAESIKDWYRHQTYHDIGDDVERGIGEPYSQAAKAMAADAWVPEVGYRCAHECRCEYRP
jgi:hypothetical protein